MSLELLTPVDDEVLESFDLLPKQVIGKVLLSIQKNQACQK